MDRTTLVPAAPVASGQVVAMPRQADTDDQLVAIWMQRFHSKHTRTAYDRLSRRFREHVDKPLQRVTVGDLLVYVASLDGMAPATRAQAIAAVKSLFAFAVRIGYVGLNPAAAISLPPIENRLAERILPEGDVQRMIALEPSPRNRAILLLLYGAGLRCAELAGLRWRNLVKRDGGGQVTVLGKGGKTRAVLLPASVWGALVALRRDAGDDDAPVFVSRNRGGPLSTWQVIRVVRAAARRAGIEKAVSPHWLRHAHASHALDRGAPVHVVQSSLGHASLATTSRYCHARPSDGSGKYLAL